jgi:hypothetical protein
MGKRDRHSDGVMSRLEPIAQLQCLLLLARARKRNDVTFSPFPGLHVAHVNDM